MRRDGEWHRVDLNERLVRDFQGKKVTQQAVQVHQIVQSPTPGDFPYIQVPVGWRISSNG